MRLVGVVDRIGGGDAFAAGMLSALLDQRAPQDAIDFATAASVYKHSVPGDVLIASKSDVEQKMRSQNLDVRR